MAARKRRSTPSTLSKAQRIRALERGFGSLKYAAVWLGVAAADVPDEIFKAIDKMCDWLTEDVIPSVEKEE